MKEQIVLIVKMMVLIVLRLDAYYVIYTVPKPTYALSHLIFTITLRINITICIL